MPENKIQYVSLGMNLAAGMAICVYGGYLLDQKYGKGGQFWVLVGMASGFIYGGYEIWKLIRQLNDH